MKIERKFYTWNLTSCKVFNEVITIPMIWFDDGNFTKLEAYRFVHSSYQPGITNTELKVAEQMRTLLRQVIYEGRYPVQQEMNNALGRGAAYGHDYEEFETKPWPTNSGI